MRLVAAFIAAAMLFVSASIAAAQSSLAGSWYGEGQPNDPSAVWLAQLSPNGMFKATFRRCVGQRAEMNVMSGRWKVSGSLMEMFVESWNDMPSAYRDGYEILANNGKMLRYKFTQSDRPMGNSYGYVFTSSRVDETFKIPGCNIVS